MKRKFFLGLISLTLALCLCITACGGLFGSGNGDENGENGGASQTTPDGSTGSSESKYSKYSPLLQEVLSDPQWDALYRRYESGEISANENTYDGGTNLLEAIPYDYLASKGEDISGIKKGAVGVNAYLYTMENDKNHIYNKLDVVYNVKNGETYINQYLLKYRITEQELDDLRMLYSGKYYQGPIMFQCLAAKQQPEVISEFSLTEKARLNIISSCNNKNNYIAGALNYNQVVSLTMISLTPTTYRDKDAYDATMYLYGKRGNSSITNRQVYKVSAKLVDIRSKVTFSNGIMDLVDLNALEPILEESTPITYFQLYHAFKDFKK